MRKSKLIAENALLRADNRAYKVSITEYEADLQAAKVREEIAVAALADTIVQALQTLEAVLGSPVFAVVKPDDEQTG